MRELQFRYHYQVSDTYGYVDKNRIVTESEVINIFSMNKTPELSVVIDSYYNGKHYLIYDMDDVNKYGDMYRNFEFNGDIW